MPSFMVWRESRKSKTIALITDY